MKKMTKLLFILTFVVLVLMLSTASALAANSGTCGTNVTWSFEGGTLTVSGNGYMDEFNLF